jgi:predicted pyridoxine 5'-phosphate oxidase superfamily flavin-nucleotide-binding protein
MTMSTSPGGARNFARYAFTPTVKKLQTEHGSRAGYARLETVERHQLGPQERLFLAQRDSFYMATVGEDGWPYVQHRGGPPGFVRVIDDATLAFADFRGNKQYISTGNILDTGRVAMIFVDYPNRRRLKVWAKGSIVDPGEDAELRDAVALGDYEADVERIFRLEVVGFDWNCPQHITPRYTRDEIDGSPTSPGATEGGKG